jgi:hypothetical protein
MRGLRGSLRVGAAFTTAVVLAAISAAYGSADPVRFQARVVSTGCAKVPPPRSNDSAVRSLVRDQRINLGAAEQQIFWQTQAAELEARLAGALGPHFGGLWIDPHRDGRIVVGVSGQERIPSMSATVSQLAAQCAVADAVKVVSVPFSLRDLKTASAWLGRQLVRVNASAANPLASSYDPSMSAVTLTLPTRGKLTKAQLAVVGEARRRYGSMIRLDRGETWAKPTLCGGNSCYPPLRAGVFIDHRPQFQECTLGFIARSRSDNKLYAFTAGHCAHFTPGGVWRAIFDGQYHDIGPVHNYAYGPVGDMAILSITNPGGWKPRAWVWVHQSSETTNDEEYYISGTRYPPLNQRVCKTGASFSSQLTDCGVVTAHDVTKTYTNPDGTRTTVTGLEQANFCVSAGDSGGPVYASHIAYGLLSGVSGSYCNVLFQSIRPAEIYMNVNVATGT